LILFLMFHWQSTKLLHLKVKKKHFQTKILKKMKIIVFQKNIMRKTSVVKIFL